MLNVFPDSSVTKADRKKEFEVRELLKEVCRERGAFAHTRDNSIGFKAVDELLLCILRRSRMVVKEEDIAEDSNRESWFESCKVRLCYALIIIEDGELDWSWKDWSHHDSLI